jgi:hypothetical protein
MHCIINFPPFFCSAPIIATVTELNSQFDESNIKTQIRPNYSFRWRWIAHDFLLDELDMTSFDFLAGLLIKEFLAIDFTYPCNH